MNISNICWRLTGLFALTALTVYSSFAQAHLKWFVEDSQQPYVYTDVISYSLGWIGIGIVILFIGIFLDKKFPKISLSWQSKNVEKYATSILCMLLGASLVISALSGNLFSMNIKDTGTLHLALLLLEGFIGLSLIFGLAVRQASVLLIGLWLITIQAAGLIVTLENLWILGAALFFLLRGRPVLRYSREDVFSSFDVDINQAQAQTFLRVFIGANLVFLGFSEKIIVPELGLAFLQEHQWNFMAHLGFSWFTDELFVFSAGAVEIILGVFLMAGLTVRLTAAVLAVLFLTPPFFMGPAEMIGHIPHISIVVMLLLFGRGDTSSAAFTTLINMPKKAKTQLPVLPANTLRNHRGDRTVHRLSIDHLLSTLYGGSIHEKPGFTAVLPDMDETQSSYPGHDGDIRYKRTVNIRKNYGTYHKTGRTLRQRYSISRLSRSRCLPLKGNRIRLMAHSE